MTGLPPAAPPFPQWELGRANGLVPNGVSAFDDAYPAVSRLDPALPGALRQAATAAAGGGVKVLVTGGWRSPAYQKQLRVEAVTQRAAAREAARWVATPQTSPQVSGNAVDTGPSRASSTATGRGTTNAAPAQRVSAHVRRPHARPQAAVTGTLGPEQSSVHSARVGENEPPDVLTARAAASAFDSLFPGLGVVALAVGAVGAANIMIVSVLERRSEIGLRRGLGAARGQIRTQFLAESVLLSIMGGVAGVLPGAVATAVYASSEGRAAVIPVEAWAGAVASAILIGAFAGLIPAIQASRMPPTVALRTRYAHDKRVCRLNAERDLRRAFRRCSCSALNCTTGRGGFTPSAVKLRNAALAPAGRWKVLQRGGGVDPGRRGLDAGDRQRCGGTAELRRPFKPLGRRAVLRPVLPWSGVVRRAARPSGSWARLLLAMA
ncbi:FtsX-like permease family protein [Deinococcus hopiensis]|uniref:FtsX-like permease family protein n=1 Tax=Deinococcus hopiensis TaxID=309885 RepID=UPI001BAE834C|nr:FtsX-like permease family protein [Deinococcus hopiensis]